MNKGFTGDKICELEYLEPMNFSVLYTTRSNNTIEFISRCTAKCVVELSGNSTQCECRYGIPPTIMVTLKYKLYHCPSSQNQETLNDRTNERTNTKLSEFSVLINNTIMTTATQVYSFLEKIPQHFLNLIRNLYNWADEDFSFFW